MSWRVVIRVHRHQVVVVIAIDTAMALHRVDIDRLDRRRRLFAERSEHLVGVQVVLDASAAQRRLAGRPDRPGPRSIRWRFLPGRRDIDRLGLVAIDERLRYPRRKRGDITAEVVLPLNQKADRQSGPLSACRSAADRSSRGPASTGSAAATATAAAAAGARRWRAGGGSPPVSCGMGPPPVSG